MAYVSKNNAYSTLAANVAAADTSLAVAAGHGDRFPVVAGTDYTFVTLENAAGSIEIVKVTARAAASDTMTIVRAQEGTTALAWTSGDIVEHRLTAGVVSSAVNAQASIDAHLADTADAHAASAITNTPAGNLAAATVQAALNELQTDVDGRQPLDATLTALAGTLTAANKIPYATALDTAGELTLDIDGTLAANSDVTIASQKAVKTYADGKAPKGAITASGLTQSTARILGRTTAATGAVEEITVGTGLSLAAGALTATSTGALVLVETRTVTAVTNIAFDLQEDVYCEWKFVFDGVIPATDDSVLRIQMGYSAGTLFETATSSYGSSVVGTGFGAGTNDVIGSDATNNGVGTAAGEHAHAVVKISAIGATLAGGFMIESTCSYTDTTTAARSGKATIWHAAAVERVWDTARFLWEVNGAGTGGDFKATGTIKMFALKRAG